MRFIERLKTFPWVFRNRGTENLLRATAAGSMWTGGQEGAQGGAAFGTDGQGMGSRRLRNHQHRGILRQAGFSVAPRR